MQLDSSFTFHMLWLIKLTYSRLSLIQNKDTYNSNLPSSNITSQLVTFSCSKFQLQLYQSHVHDNTYHKIIFDFPCELLLAGTSHWTILVYIHSRLHHHDYILTLLTFVCNIVYLHSEYLFTESWIRYVHILTLYL